MAFAQQGRAFMNHFLAFGLGDQAGRDRVVDGMLPLGLNGLDRSAHAHAVDLTVGSECAHHHRHRVPAPLGIDDMGEQKRLALGLVHAADKLPAHQGMELSVLVDGAVNDLQQAAAFELLQVIMQVGVAGFVLAHVFRGNQIKADDAFFWGGPHLVVLEKNSRPEMN